MVRTHESPGDDSRAPSGTQQATTATVILTRPGDRVRARRLRKFARRHLDELLGAPDPWTFSEPVGDPYADSWLNRGVPERDRAGRELAEAGWTP